MAYEIEDIDWRKMPEGAVEFMLENQNDYLTWITRDGKYMYRSDVLYDWEVETKWRDSDKRTRYKVSDYHPEQKVWNGEGLPSVGTVCEVQGYASSTFTRIEIVAYNSDRSKFWYLSVEDGINGIQDIHSCTFRPIKSNKDEFVEQVDAMFYLHGEDLKLVADIYDAIVSGKLEVKV